jgi:hypothetical protein
LLNAKAWSYYSAGATDELSERALPALQLNTTRWTDG